MAAIVIVCIVVLLLMALLWTWYKRTIAGLGAGDTNRQVRGARLTADALRGLPGPPFRVVPEIAPDALGGIDHVVIGPAGAIAIETTIGSGVTVPAADTPDEARAVAAGAIVRGAVDDLLAGSGTSCVLYARVDWAMPEPGEEPVVELRDREVAVQGGRLVEWIQSLPPGQNSTAQVDLAWQRIVTGIGRPDPLA